MTKETEPSHGPHARLFTASLADVLEHRVALTNACSELGYLIVCGAVFPRVTKPTAIGTFLLGKAFELIHEYLGCVSLVCVGAFVGNGLKLGKHAPAHCLMF